MKDTQYFFKSTNWYAFYEVRSKSSKPHPERNAIAEHFCCGNTLQLFITLEKLIQISVLISVQARLIERWEVCDKSKILMRLRTFVNDPRRLTYFNI